MILKFNNLKQAILLQFRIFSTKNFVRFELFMRFFCRNYFEIKKLYVGQKFKN